MPEKNSTNAPNDLPTDARRRLADSKLAAVVEAAYILDAIRR